MASITIRNLDDSLKRCLRIRAAKHVAPWKKRPERSSGTPLRRLHPRPIWRPRSERALPRLAASTCTFRPESRYASQRIWTEAGMIILDTNVISERLRRAPDPALEAWLSEQSGAQIYLTAISKAELRYGVTIMANGKRQRMLAEAVEGILREEFRDRILAFDSAAADHYAEIAARRRSDGRLISPFDCQITSIARVRAAAVATRKIDDFEGCGIEVIDPWRHGKYS